MKGILLPFWGKQKSKWEGNESLHSVFNRVTVQFTYAQSVAYLLGWYFGDGEDYKCRQKSFEKAAEPEHSARSCQDFENRQLGFSSSSCGDGKLHVHELLVQFNREREH